jgi:hypothetical protein
VSENLIYSSGDPDEPVYVCVQDYGCSVKDVSIELETVRFENGEMLFDLGVKIKGRSAFNPSYYHPEYKALGLTESNYVMYSTMYDTVLTDPEAKVIGYSRNTFFNRAPEHFCSHKHTPFVAENNAPAAVIGKEGG